MDEERDAETSEVHILPPGNADDRTSIERGPLPREDKYVFVDLGPAEADIEHPVAGRNYDPQPRREMIRGQLALASFGLFAIFAVGISLAIVLGYRTWSDLEGATGSLLPAIVSVVGTTTGFYFGTKAKEPE